MDIDPVVQDLNEYHDKLAKYNREHQEVEKRILEDSSTADGFIQELYKLLSDKDIEEIGARAIDSNIDNWRGIWLIINKHYNEYVDKLIEEES